MSGLVYNTFIVKNIVLEKNGKIRKRLLIQGGDDMILRPSTAPPSDFTPCDEYPNGDAFETRDSESCAQRARVLQKNWK